MRFAITRPSPAIVSMLTGQFLSNCEEDECGVFKLETVTEVYFLFFISTCEGDHPADAWEEWSFFALEQ